MGIAFTFMINCYMIFNSLGFSLNDLHLAPLPVRFGCLVLSWGLAEMLNSWKWAEVIHTQLAACNSS